MGRYLGAYVFQVESPKNLVLTNDLVHFGTLIGIDIDFFIYRNSGFINMAREFPRNMQLLGCVDQSWYEPKQPISQIR